RCRRDTGFRPSGSAATAMPPQTARSAIRLQHYSLPRRQGHKLSPPTEQTRSARRQGTSSAPPPCRKQIAVFIKGKALFIPAGAEQVENSVVVARGHLRE